MNLRNPVLTINWLLIIIAISNSVVAQDFSENNFTHYAKEQGLSNNVVTGLAQDSTGYIWITTYSGLNRFNGTSFEQFHSSNDSFSIPEENLKGLVWLDKYRLAAYAGGLHIIDTRTGVTRNLFIPYSNKQYQFKFNWILAVESNTAGDIFLLTRSGFYHFDINYQLVFRFDYYTNEEVANTSFTFGRQLISLDDHRFAITSSDGIYFYDSGKKQFRKMERNDDSLFAGFLDYPETDYQFYQQTKGCFLVMYSNADSLVYINIPEHKRLVGRLPFKMARNEFDYRSDIMEANDTTLYITGSVSGFYKITLCPESGKITFYPQKNCPFFNCRHLLKDRDQNLWIATNKGIFTQNNYRSHIQQASLPASVDAAFPNVSMDDIYADGNRLYAATHGSCGLLVFDKQSLHFIRRIGFEKFKKSANYIMSIVPIDDDHLLVGTDGPLLRLNTRTYDIMVLKPDKWKMDTDWAADLFKDRKGNIWIASDNVYKYDVLSNKFSIIYTSGKPFTKIERAQRLQGDPSGNIWIAGHGLVRYNTSIDAFDRLVDSFPFIKIPDRQVNTFLVDHQNNLWINSNNNGLTCYNVDKGVLHHFTRDDGLPDNNIANMITIGNKLWIATFSGIACIDMQTFRITSFGIEDGFPDVPITIGAKFFYDSSDSKLYIGFSNTIVRFDPGIIFHKTKAPGLFIESLITGDKKIFSYPGKNTTTSWKNNSITVMIGSINFITASSQRFAYRLFIDDSSRWQQLGNQNTFSVSNLSTGYQRIQVKLYSLNNRWPEQVMEFGITITPPFWKQAWFLVISGILLALITYQLLLWRTGNIRRKEQAKTHIQKLKAEEYKNQYELEQISNYFSSSMAGKKNVDDVLWDVTKNLIGRMNYEDCIIYMWNDDKTKMIQKAAHGPKENIKTINTQAFDVAPGQGLVGHVMLTKEPLLVGNTSTDRRYRVDDMMRLSELCVPIIHNNELIGIIDSEHGSANHFQDRDIKILTTIATLVGNKIKQLESEQLLEVKQMEIALINQQLAEAQLSALQTQMNPHFIFNSLNSIKGMILLNEQQKASRYLSKFANMIRTTLNQSKVMFTTLHENIEHLESYLVMEKLRFDDSFTFRCTVDEDIDEEDTLIPTLMLQPLAENAIWHGLMHKSGEKKLAIRFAKFQETICCSIEDNGIGIKQSEQLKLLNKTPYKPVGLNNLRNRIKILNEKFDTGCTLEIHDLQDLNKSKTGTRVILCFKILINKTFL